jgi:polysaccharide deacetylase family protein (PEP-CTERM system associated)
MSPVRNQIVNYLSIDVEDYFQVSGFESVVGINNWKSYEARIQFSTEKILGILAESEIKATFFVVGWLAEKYPDLIKTINEYRHEIACHSYSHRLIYEMTPEEFKVDTIRAKESIENIIGEKVRGYRAPSYSITKDSVWAFKILDELGFEYDSSIFPIWHDRYGMVDAPRFEYLLPGTNMKEYPISTFVLLGHRIPVSGGGYFRLFPYWFTRMALTHINRKEKMPFVFYIHPWELDPDQPRINGTGILSRFRHYVNLAKTTERFRRLLADFNFAPFSGDD